MRSEGKSTSEKALTATLPGAATSGVGELASPGHIGRYRITGGLGKGAMGIVYAAYDPELDRRVAIKCLRPGIRNPDLAHRLRREAQALARLSHPNVVAVHDVGWLEDHGEKRLFIAMDYVDGTTLADWLDAEPRSWKQIVDLMIQAGSGLAAAHQAGLLHRDFKPENVLVTADGRAQVADFGLACSVSEADGESAGTGKGGRTQGDERSPDAPWDPGLTVPGGVVGTPAYIAPECLEGEADERSDQYSFATTLYEALYGHRPFDESTSARLYAAKIRGEIQPPGKGSLVPRWVHRAMLRGLDAKPERRWSSLESLLEALGGAAYRKKQLLAIAAILLLTTVAVTNRMLSALREPQTVCEATAAPWKGVWDSKQRRTVERSFRESGAVFAEESFARFTSQLDRYTEDWSQAREYVCGLQKEHKVQDVELHRHMVCFAERQEEVRTLVDVVGRADRAIVSRAVTAVRNLDPPSDCRLAQSWLPAGDEDSPQSLRQVLARARAHRLTGLASEALPIAKAAVQQARPLGGNWLAEALFELGSTRRDLSDYENATTDLDGAWRAALASRNDYLAAQSLIRIAHIHSAKQARFDESLARLEEAEALIGRMAPDEATKLEPRLWAGFGSQYVARSEYAEAQSYYERALHAYREREALRSIDAASIYGRIGICQMRLGHYEQAQAAFENALELRRELLGPSHPSLPAVMNNLGALAATRGFLKEGEERLRDSLELSRRLTPGHSDLVSPLNNLGLLALSRGGYERAKAALEEAVDIGKETLGSESPKVARPLSNLGRVLTALGEFEEAENKLSQALEIRETLYGPDNPNTLSTLMAIADLYVERGDFDRAISLHRRTLETRIRTLKENHFEIAQSHTSLASALRRAGKAEMAETHVRKAVDLLEGQIDDENRKWIPVWTELGETLLARGKSQQARQWLEKAASHEKPGEHSPLARSDLRFALARALPSEDPRALALAQEAAREIAEHPAANRRKDAIRGWLASRNEETSPMRDRT